MLLCFAELPGGLVYEVIEPVVGAGGNIFEDWLRVKGEGVGLPVSFFFFFFFFFVFFFFFFLVLFFF